MRVAELIAYAAERGTAFVKNAGRLELRDAGKLTPLLEKALRARRAEIYAHYGLVMPSEDCRDFEACPKCGHRLDKATAEEGGEF